MTNFKEQQHIVIFIITGEIFLSSFFERYFTIWVFGGNIKIWKER